MQEAQEKAMNRGGKYILRRWDAVRNCYRCVDNIDIATQSKVFQLPGLDESGFVGTDSKVVFMNRIVYKKTEKDVRLRIQIFVSESEFDRSISAIVKAANDIKSVTFPNSIKEARTGVFKKNKQLSSVILNEGLERLDGPDDN